MVERNQLYFRYDIVGQRPDQHMALNPSPATDHFMAVGSAFTASTVGAFNHPRMVPADSVGFAVTLTCHQPTDAVRVRAYSWVKNEAGQWVTEDWFSEPMNAQGLVEAPRSSGCNLTDQWNNRTRDNTYWVLEVKGAPSIYCAYIWQIVTVPTVVAAGVPEWTPAAIDAVAAKLAARFAAAVRTV